MASSPFPRAPQGPTGPLQRVEDVVLALLLGAMIVLAPAQILLRALGTGLPWVDPLLRVLVLWVGLLGAVAASWEGRHITIDVLSRVLPERARAAAGAVTSLFTAAVTALVATHAARFVASELAVGSVGFSEVRAWWLQAVIPFSFAAIALRYLRLALSELLALFRKADAGGGTGSEAGSR